MPLPLPRSTSPKLLIPMLLRRGTDSDGGGSGGGRARGGGGGDDRYGSNSEEVSQLGINACEQLWRDKRKVLLFLLLSFSAPRP